MATVTPAYITYTPEGGQEQTIEFHAVISEGHKTSAEVTKYPSQEGFHVSNHSIRKNREVTIEGVISNIKLNGSASREYGGINTVTVKEAIDALINSGEYCTVTTNLGVYDPVILNKFTTKQAKGMVDSMQFTIGGEEIVEVPVDNYVAPVPVTFTTVTGAERDAVVTELEEVGYPTSPSDKISVGYFDHGESFSVPAALSSGLSVETVFEYVGTDPVSGAARYRQHLSESSVRLLGQEEQLLSPGCSASSSDRGGIDQVASCLLREGEEILMEAARDTYNTAMGELRRSIYGYVYDTVSMDNKYGQALAMAGIGCLVRGVTQASDEYDYLPGESLPTFDAILNGMFFNTSPKPRQSLIKINCECDDSPTLDIDDALLPIS
jgi:hypothetical protein